MAFYDEEQEEDQVGQGPQTTGPQSGVVGADGGAQASASNGATPAPGASAAAPKREPFVGISEYINANKPQSEKLAGQVAGNVETKAQGVDSALSGAQNSFNQAADSQKVVGDDSLFGAVQSNAAKVAGDKAQADQFAKLRDATYTGPQKLEDLNSGSSWAGIQSALQKAKQAKEGLGTEAGRMGLIKEISNNPRQSQGALVFDNLLLQSNPNSASKLQQAGSSLNDIDARLGSANQSAQAKAKEIAANNAAVSGQAKGALSSGYTGLGSDLASREAAKDVEQKSSANALKKALSSGSLTAEQYKALGLSPDFKTFGVDAGKYLDYVDGADKYGVATKDDLAKQAALKQLAGSYDLGEDILGSAKPIGQLGKGYNLRSNELQGATGKLQAQYTAEVAPLQKEYVDLMNVYQGIMGQNKAGTSAQDMADAYSAKNRADKLMQQISVLTTKYKADQTLGSKGNAPVGALASPQLISSRRTK